MKEFLRMLIIGTLIALCIVPAIFGLIALVFGIIALGAAYGIFALAGWFSEDYIWRPP